MKTNYDLTELLKLVKSEYCTHFLLREGCFNSLCLKSNSGASPDGAFLVDGGLSLLLSVVEAAVAGIVGSGTLVAATVGGAGEGSAGTDTVGGGTAGIASAETSDGAELGISVAVDNLTTSVLNASLGSVIELVEVTVATGDSAGHLNVSGVVSIVGHVTLVIDELSAVVVVVGTVVPGSEVVGPAAIAEVGTVGIAVRVGSWGIAEGVSAEADGVADVARGVLVTLVAEASLLLAEVVVVVTGDGVEGDVDLAGVVAPLVINGFLGIEVIVGSPLVPCVVNPLVVALALVADLSVGVVVISDVPLLLSLGATEGTAGGTNTTNTEASDTSSATNGTTSDASSTEALSSEATSGGAESASSSESASTSESALSTETEASAAAAEAEASTSSTSGVARAKAVASAVALSVGEAISVIGALVAVVLVVGTISLRLDSIVVGSLPGLSGDDSGGEKYSLEHF